MRNGQYRQFALTLLASFVLMYAIMFLNVKEIGHVYINITRLYMTLMMTSAMALLMLTLMSDMYQNKRKNTWLIASSITVFVFAFIGVHKQVGVSDIQYMKGMIPHHSIAIMTSKNAHITDPRVRQLANDIIDAQEREITEMRALIDSLKQNR